MHMPPGAFTPAGVADVAQELEIIVTLDRPPVLDDGSVTGELNPAALAAVVAGAFRMHGHICNVVTHISGGRWDLIEEALVAILDPDARAQEMTPLAWNIIELLGSGRGVTGPIVKPYFRMLIARVLPADLAARMCAHVTCLAHDHKQQTSSNQMVRFMNGHLVPANERVIDVREISPKIRHTIIMQLFDNLQMDQTLQLIVDHEPRRLKLSMDVRYDGRFLWDYLESGPDLWRVRIARAGRQ